VVTLFVGGCTWHRHKTFEEKFEYKSGKVMKYIKKVVSDKGKLERIEKKILAYKPKLNDSYESFKKDKEELKSLLPKTKNKEEVKSKLKSLADKKVGKYNLMVDLMFEIKAELSEEEWNKLAEIYSKKCSHRWK
jgi:nitrate reductase beta subunit